MGPISLGDYFDAIAEGADITHFKPEPEAFGASRPELRRGGRHDGGGGFTAWSVFLFPLTCTASLRETALKCGPIRSDLHIHSFTNAL